MIRRATAIDIPDYGTDESLIRIIALKKAYGYEASFIQYFTDEMGGFLSIMDGVAVLYVPALSDEWQMFLRMNPDIRRLHCPAFVGQPLLDSAIWQGGVGEVLRYEGVVPTPQSDVCSSPYLPDVYALLRDHFPHIAPLEYWYPDVSHRVRHGCCHIGCVLRENRVVSTAMTVAETDNTAILGQVATDPAYRRQGMAVTCIKSVIEACKGMSLYILPVNEYAAQLYRKIGFSLCGHWAELEKIN